MGPEIRYGPNLGPQAVKERSPFDTTLVHRFLHFIKYFKDHKFHLALLITPENCYLDYLTQCQPNWVDSLNVTSKHGMAWSNFFSFSSTATRCICSTSLDYALDSSFICSSVIQMCTRENAHTRQPLGPSYGKPNRAKRETLTRYKKHSQPIFSLVGFRDVLLVLGYLKPRPQLSDESPWV